MYIPHKRSVVPLGLQGGQVSVNCVKQAVSVGFVACEGYYLLQLRDWFGEQLVGIYCEK